MLYWKYSSFENITLFQEANILLLIENLNLFFFTRKRKKAIVPYMSDLSCFTESTEVLKISCYFRRQISYCLQKTWTYFYYQKEKEGFWPIYVRFVLLYWKYSSFENIMLFQEANILLLTKKKAFVPFMSVLSCFTESAAVLKISPYFRRQIFYWLLKTWTYFYNSKEEEGFCPIYVTFVLLYWKYHSFENITLFQEANILMLTKNLNLFLTAEAVLVTTFTPPPLQFRQKCFKYSYNAYEALLWD